MSGGSRPLRIDRCRELPLDVLHEREEDPEAFREAMGRIVRKRLEKGMRQHRDRLDAGCQELSRKYYAAEGEEEKAAVKKELEAQVQNAFDERMKAQKAMVVQMEQRLDALRRMVKERESKREEICKKRVDELTADPDLRW